MSVQSRFIRLTPTDTWFFRDGRPFNQDDEGLAQARSLFPPHPSTVTGAVRAALALAPGQGQGQKEPGWSGHGGWNPDLVALLGDGPEMTGGQVSFGPLLILRNDQPLYPAPLFLTGNTVVRGKDIQPLWGDFGLLRPGPPVDCDLGTAVRLPVGSNGPADKRRSVEKLWLTKEGLELVLAGRTDQLRTEGDERHIFHSEELWKIEPRVGLARDNQKRTAVQGQLYAPVHIRLVDGVALGVAVSGPSGMKGPVRLVSLGGEHRTAEVEAVDDIPDLPSPPRFQPTADGRGQAVTLTLITPARAEAAWLDASALLPCGARIVSACLGKPVPIGGWDSRGAKGTPRPLRRFLPAGSTWFLHAPPGWTPPDFIGNAVDARHGFGHFVLGTFTDSDNTGADAAHKGDQS